MDETDSPQTPPELLVILAALADESVPLQTIAPKFTGRFNKGVDYVGDLAQFEKEFRDDLAVIAFAVQKFRPAGEPETERAFGQRQVLDLRRSCAGRSATSEAGLHLKTAGTTWLEEVIGLAEAGGDGLALAKEIYAKAPGEEGRALRPVRRRDRHRRRRSCRRPTTVNGWSAEQFVAALRHDPANPAFNPSLRQLIHVGFKIAAQMGDRYLKMLEAVRADHREERDGEPLRPAPEAAVRKANGPGKRAES